MKPLVPKYKPVPFVCVALAAELIHKFAAVGDPELHDPRGRLPQVRRLGPVAEHVEPCVAVEQEQRPVEREATHRAISLAELIDVPMMVVHISNGEAMEEVRRAYNSGEF